MRHIDCLYTFVYVGRKACEDLATLVQVKRAQAHLLEHLYSAVTTLGGAEAEFLLEEDSDSAVKREKLKQVGNLSRWYPWPALALNLMPHIC